MNECFNLSQTCSSEIKQSASALKEHLLDCIADLDEAEAVWLSKQRIAEVPDAYLWEKVGGISGCWNRIQQLATERKEEIIEQAKQNWLNQIEKLKEKFFFDVEKKQYRVDVGWADKDGFNRELPGGVSIVSESLDRSIRETLQELLQELDINHLRSVELFISLLDPQSEQELTQEKRSLLKRLYQRFNQPLDNLLADHSPSLNRAVDGVVREWRDRFRNISWREVENFREKTLKKIEERAESTISDRLVMINEVVNCSISFYNSFLDRQNRYQQETPEQYLADKAWIDQQRQHFQLLLTNLEISLEFSENFSNS
jgi:hypothetical protein